MSTSVRDNAKHTLIYDLSSIAELSEMNEAEFSKRFQELTGNAPLAWQFRLFEKHFATNSFRPVIDLPTGLGKTMVMAIWVTAPGSGSGFGIRDSVLVSFQWPFAGEPLRLIVQFAWHLAVSRLTRCRDDSIQIVRTILATLKKSVDFVWRTRSHIPKANAAYHGTNLARAF